MQRISLDGDFVEFRHILQLKYKRNGMENYQIYNLIVMVCYVQARHFLIRFFLFNIYTYIFRV